MEQLSGEVALHGLPVLRRGPRARRVRRLPSRRPAEEGLLQAVLDAGQHGGQGPGHRPGAVPARDPPPAAQLRRHAALGLAGARAPGRQGRPAGRPAPAGAARAPPCHRLGPAQAPGRQEGLHPVRQAPPRRPRESVAGQGPGRRPGHRRGPRLDPLGRRRGRSRPGHPAVRPCRRRRDLLFRDVPRAPRPRAQRRAHRGGPGRARPVPRRPCPGLRDLAGAQPRRPGPGHPGRRRALAQDDAARRPALPAPRPRHGLGLPARCRPGADRLVRALQPPARGDRQGHPRSHQRPCRPRAQAHPHRDPVPVPALQEEPHDLPRPRGAAAGWRAPPAASSCR